MIDPLPNCFSIWPTARSSAFRRSLRSSRSRGMVLLAAAGDSGREQCKLLHSRDVPIGVSSENAHQAGRNCFGKRDLRRRRLSPQQLARRSFCAEQPAPGCRNGRWLSAGRRCRVPSPVGHVLGGLAAGWLVAGRSPAAAREPQAGSSPRVHALDRDAVLYALLGAAPDVDLLFAAHSTYTHSIGAVAVTALAALLWTRGRQVLPAVACAAALASHV